VEGNVATTVTPGNGSPLGSIATPDMDPVVAPWAWTNPVHRRVHIAKQMNFFIIMTSLFLP
jgi:hypothetical protein